MPFKVENPNLCCECKVTSPAKPCSCPKNDCCLSLCSFSVIPPITNKEDSQNSVDILGNDCHNLTVCGDDPIETMLIEYFCDDFTSIELNDGILSWTTSMETCNEFSEVIIHVKCGCYSAYMTVLIKL